MNSLTDAWINPGLAILVDWSIRWGIVLAVLAAWFRLRPPRRAETRHLLCLSALVAGVLLPLAPRWGDAAIPWPSRQAESVPIPAFIPGGPEAMPVLPIEITQQAPQPRAREDAARVEPARRVAPLEPIRPTSAPLDVRRMAALFAAGAWGAVMLTMLVRLVCGKLMLFRLRRGAVMLDQGSDGLLGECRTVLGLSRSVGLAVHPAVATPVVIGGLRPLVLVPSDWRDWPESHRRGCLLHELAHLARYDDWAKLVQELVRAPLFFHPLVRWLLARLDRERELLCDEAAVALGSDPVEYARLLLDMARRPGRLVPVIPFTRHGWLPFLDRRTVEVRIERLLEADMRSTFSRPSAVRSMFFGGLALAAALAVGGLRVHAVVAEPPKEAKSPATKDAPREVRGVVLDPDGKPVAGATIVAGATDPGKAGHEVIMTDVDGRFTWLPSAATKYIGLVASKAGFAASAFKAPLHPDNFKDLKLRLGKPETFAALLVDVDGKPIAGAKLRIDTMATGSVQKDNNGFSSTVMINYTYVPREVVEGSPVEDQFTTTTDSTGSFTFKACPPGAGLKLAVTTFDGRAMRIKPGAVSDSLRRSMHDQGFATAPPGENPRLMTIPAARVSGRVVSKVPDVDVDGLRVEYRASAPVGQYRPSGNAGAHTQTDSEGRFVFEDLSEGTINVLVEGAGVNERWTHRAAENVGLSSGVTSEVTIELIRGVDVLGMVVAQGTEAPVAGARVASYGPCRPHTSYSPFSVKTDARGRYRYRLPSGETSFLVAELPDGFTNLPDKGSTRTVTIPDDVARFQVPPIEVVAAVTVRGKVVDATGSPIVGAKVVGNCEGGICRPFPGSEVLTDGRGEFRLPPGFNNTVAIGRAARLLIRLNDGVEHEAAATPADDGWVVVKLPVGGKSFGSVEGPRDVPPGELAGVVVDTDGKPIEGAEVDAWTWYPGNEAKTDAKGFFRIRKLDDDGKVEVIVRKAGYTPQLFLMQPTGKPGWVIVLGNKTYFEGRVTDPDGKPVANARLRANNGPKQAYGVRITEIWTEATTDKDGRYRMYAQADVYDIQVRVPGVGVARRPETSLGTDEAKTLDIKLDPGVTFYAKVVDSLTGKPVPEVRLWNWQQKGIEGRSDQDGVVKIADMLPGKFNFQVDAKGYARWWSEEAVSEWNRHYIDDSRTGWQRNFDALDFDLKPGLFKVMIAVEKGVTVTGRVLDPDGKPVVGATVDPARTGSGNSLTGDTRFSVRTGEGGKFTATLPASGAAEYNLVAHDGKYSQWRNWANGVLPPIRTKPGDALQDVEIRLTRPATVRGRVLDTEGRPIANREVRASAADRLENRYYDPTVKTKSDGTYELKFVRPGEHFIQVAPFWLDAEQAPNGTSNTLTLKQGETQEGVDFKIPKGGEGN
jgi:protocatechuate 3,4-dioxygenase beta subunit